MGTTKRTITQPTLPAPTLKKALAPAPKPLPKAVSSLGGVPVTLGAVLAPLTVSLRENGKALAETVRDLVAKAIAKQKPVMDQDTLRALFAYSTMPSMTEKTWSMIVDAVKEFRKEGGVFEEGKYDALFPESSARSVKWKEEAIKLAEELATLKKLPWSSTEFVEGIQTKYPQNTSTRVQITEAADG